METAMTETTREALAAQLGLVAAQIAHDPVWAVRQIESLAETSLHGWYRAERGAVPGEGPVAAACRAARGDLAEAADRAFYAHALAANEDLAEAALHMERLAVRDPRAEYFQFLASVYERADRLPEALRAARKGLAAEPGSLPLTADAARIDSALRRRAARDPQAALALWQDRGGTILGAVALGLRIVAIALHYAKAGA